MSILLTPDGKHTVRDSGPCDCQSHCPNTCQHDSSCCDQTWCDCSCHREFYEARQAAGRGAIIEE